MIKTNLSVRVHLSWVALGNTCRDIEFCVISNLSEHERASSPTTDDSMGARHPRHSLPRESTSRACRKLFAFTV